MKIQAPLHYHHGNDGLLPSQFIFVWVHVTKEERRQELLTFGKNIREHSVQHLMVHWVQ